MPEVSQFLGIFIRLYYRDQAPPHLHAEYGDYEVALEIETGVVRGEFPRRALAALLEWYSLHEAELLDRARLAAEDCQFDRIAPLE